MATKVKIIQKRKRNVITKIFKKARKEKSQLSTKKMNDLDAQKKED